MALARRTTIGPLADEVARLRGQLDSMQRRRADTALVPVPAPLASLFPDGGLRPGSTYSVTGSTSLLLALLSEASKAGSWCAVLGLPDLGGAAAAAYGIDLQHLILIPEPGERWMSAASAVAEVVPIVAIHPHRRPHDAEVARLSARLRDRGGVLLIAGDWPQADASLRLTDSSWSGIGDGHGILRSRTVTVIADAKRTPRPRRVTVQLPSAHGGIASTPLSAPVRLTPREYAGTRTEQRSVQPLGHLTAVSS